MDIVYLVKPGERNDELRLSLRSLVNMPHDQVVIAGYSPNWVTNVVRLPVPQTGPRKYLNAARNLLAACSSTDITQQFVLFNDDFFVVKPLEAIPTHHRGLLATVMNHHKKRYGTNGYYRGMEESRKWLEARGHDEPLSYHLHTPMIVDKTVMKQVLEDSGIHTPGGRPEYHLRTMYGNVARVGGDRIRDCKVASSASATLTAVQRRGLPYISTSDRSFQRGAVGNYLRGLFPTPGPYEKS